MDFAGSLREGCNSEEMKVDADARKQAGAKQAAQSDEAQNADVANVRDSLLWRGEVLPEEKVAGLLKNGWICWR